MHANKSYYYFITSLLICSQIFVMRWSFDVFAVLVFPFDSSVSQFFTTDVIFAVARLPRSSPVPGKSAHKLHSRHFLICQIRDDLEHATTVSVEAEHILIEELVFPHDLLQVKGAKCETTNHPLSVHGITPQQFFHNSLI